jgi:hypothetical protein
MSYYPKTKHCNFLENYKNPYFSLSSDGMVGIPTKKKQGIINMKILTTLNCLHPYH